MALGAAMIAAAAVLLAGTVAQPLTIPGGGTAPAGNVPGLVQLLTSYSTGVVTLSKGGKCIDVKYARFAPGTSLQLYECNGTPAQKFYVEAPSAIAPNTTANSTTAPAGVNATAAASPAGNSTASGTSAVRFRTFQGDLCIGVSNELFELQNCSTAQAFTATLGPGGLVNVALACCGDGTGLSACGNAVVVGTDYMAWMVRPVVPGR